MRRSLSGIQARVIRLAEQIERQAANTVDVEELLAILDEGRRRNAAGIPPVRGRDDARSSSSTSSRGANGSWSGGGSSAKDRADYYPLQARVASPQRETALSDARRTRAQQARAMEARIVFGRGGKRVLALEGRIRVVHRCAAGSPRGIARRDATPAETRPNRTEKRAARHRHRRID